MSKKINPFVVYGYIPAEYFCDRREESRKLRKFLQNQQNVVLSAARRMGKTKLVDYVFDLPEIKDNYITVSIDILDTGNLSEFVFALGNAVFRKIARRSDRLMKLFPMVMKSLQAKLSLQKRTFTLWQEQTPKKDRRLSRKCENHRMKNARLLRPPNYLTSH